MTAGDRPDIDWLTKDGIINFYSGSEIGFSAEKSQVVVHISQLKSESLVSLISQVFSLRGNFISLLLVFINKG